MSDLEDILGVLRRCRLDLESQGIYQWTDQYPNGKDLSVDIYLREGYVYVLDNRIIGFQRVGPVREPEYSQVQWKGRDPVSVNRICVEPSCHRRGIGSAILKNSEEIAFTLGADSIQRDGLIKNRASIGMYLKQGYEPREPLLYFPGRKDPFLPMEIILRIESQ
jgi:GNAT superfamily N-acetyltransferase